MILARQVFQVKFGHMDDVLAAFKAVSESGQGSSNGTRVLTDISGKNFTLVIETKAESLDAYWEALQAMFKDPEQAAQFNTIMQYIESGHKEFYTIEYEAGR
jgi:hypothetical protein